MKKENNYSEKFIALTSKELRSLLPSINDIKHHFKIKDSNGNYAGIHPAEFTYHLGISDNVFYIERNLYDHFEINDKIKGNNSQERLAGPSDPLSGEMESEQSELDIAADMDIIEKIQSLMNSNYRLKFFIGKGGKHTSETTDEIVKILSRALCINKIVLEENIKTPLEEDKIHKIINETRLIANNIITLVTSSKFTYQELSKLEHVNTGSPTLNHMARILVRYISFLFFYNMYFAKYPEKINKYRVSFKKNFLPHYDKVTKGSQNVSLEIVFKNGMGPVLLKTTFTDYVMGGFMHDIGKLHLIDYHDGGEVYDFKKARRHVLESYRMMASAKKMPPCVVAMSLLHHEYYGADFGYRHTEIFRKTYRGAAQREVSKTKFFISDDVNDIVNGNAIAYFPNKVLELLDIFDSMTASDKKYRKKIFSPDDAVLEIRREYIDRDNLGIDPVLFNIFVDFLKASEVLKHPDMAESVKI